MIVVYFSYVVPPLEGLWKQGAGGEIDYARKKDFEWTSMIRLPEFVTKEEFDWALREASEKKRKDFSKVAFFTYHEGLCVQCMHVGCYDREPETIRRMRDFTREQGFVEDFTDGRLHHEIYLSDPRKAKPDNLRTVIRHPVRRQEEN